jgi:hypothetical protein
MKMKIVAPLKATYFLKGREEKKTLGNGPKNNRGFLSYSVRMEETVWNEEHGNNEATEDEEFGTPPSRRTKKKERKKRKKHLEKEILLDNTTREPYPF